jgi:hypothetical protein
VHIVHTVPDWFETLSVMVFSVVVTPIVVYYALKHRDAKGIRMPKLVLLSIVLFATLLTLMVFTWFISTRTLQWTMNSVFMCLNFFYFSTIVQASLYYLLKSLLISLDNDTYLPRMG